MASTVARPASLGSAGVDLANSPYVVAQRERLRGMFGEAAGWQSSGTGEQTAPKSAEPAQRVQAALEVVTTDQAAEAVQRAPAPNHTGLPDALKAGVESLSGMSLDHVKVHYNSSRPAQLHALAFAQGNEIHLAPQQEGQLPHETWHVVQQAGGGVRSTVDVDGVPVNDDPGLEAEADRMGAKALAMGSSIAQGPATGSAEGRTLSAAPAQLRSQGAVVQRSSEGVDVGDEAAAQAAIQRGLTLIQQAMQGQQQAAAPVGFSNVATTHPGPVATERKSIQVLLNRGTGWERIYITPSQRADLHLAAQQNGWHFRYNFLGVEYTGQFTQPQYQRDVVMGRFQPVQLVATVAGALNINAVKVAAANPNLANATLTYQAVNAQNVATGMDATSVHRQPMGGAVGNTRPNQWAAFLAMAGALNPFKQGHQLSKELGGDGTHDNLAPFTASLNALHCTRVENAVINQTDNPPRFDEYADYSVYPTYAGNPGIAAYAIARFNGMTVAAQLGAMVNAGVVTAAAAALILGAPTPPPHALLPGQILAAHAWITNYVTTTFPTHITCTATFVDWVPANAQYEETAAQVVTITNDF